VTTERANDRRWALARQVSSVVRRRYPADVRAVGTHGSVVHGSRAASVADVEPHLDVVVITYRPGAGPRPTARRVDGILLTVTVAGADAYLGQARSLTASWPLVADKYLSATALYDESGWHDGVREAHLERLQRATTREFAELARQAWCQANTHLELSSRAGGWYDSDSALLLLAAARVSTALTQGLLDRKYYRSSDEAVRSTGVSDADLTVLRRKLEEQATELERRGRPVDSTVDELF
jgi:hypothetical protein